MKKRPKNKTKLKGAEASKSAPVVQVATQLGVHRSSVYRWRKHAKALEANKKTGNKYYVRTSAHDALRVRYPVLEKQCARTANFASQQTKPPSGTPHHPQRQQNQKRNAGGCGLVC
ncbi:hypothetical protein PC117_g24231 [Phytophthora cactorum]|uniref:Homeodomain-like n=1 Tax=Phytophthora cactorum TaxID=29920 RepID=A0A8T1B070_9STRA|nr:hypothetical protein PC117_g24231 [Phytophthora cactorum]